MSSSFLSTVGRTLLIIILISSNLQFTLAQQIPNNPNKIDKSGLRQGKWTITYDIYGVLTENRSKIDLYRLITYKDDKPVGESTIHYKDGTLLWKGTLLVDRPEEIIDGEACNYRINGSREKCIIYDKGEVMASLVYNEDDEDVTPWEILTESGNVYYYDGQLDEAIYWYKRALSRSLELGKSNKTYLASILNLAYTYFEVGAFKEAAPLYEDFIPISRGIYGDKDPIYMNGLKNLIRTYESLEEYEKAEPLYIEVLEIQSYSLKNTDPDYINTLIGLTSLYEALKQYEKARPLYLEIEKNLKKIEKEAPAMFTIAINNLAVFYTNIDSVNQAEKTFTKAREIIGKNYGKEHPDYLSTSANMAQFYVMQNNYSAAESIYWEIYELQRKINGVNHPDYAEAAKNLAMIYQVQNNYSSAELFYWEVHEIHKESGGVSHPDYMISLDDLANAYYMQGKYDQAEPLYLEAKGIIEVTLGKNNAGYLQSVYNLAELYEEQGRFDMAKQHYQEVLGGIKKISGKTDLLYTNSLNGLARIFKDQGLYDKAETLLKEENEILLNNIRKDSISYVSSLNNLAGLFDAQGKFSKSEAYYLEAINICKETLGEGNPLYGTSINNLGTLYYSSGLYNEAESKFEEASKIFKKVYGIEDPIFATSLDNLANVNAMQGSYDKAEEMFLEAKEIREKLFGKKHIDYSHSLNNLANLYISQKKYSKAESLLLESNGIIKNMVGEDHLDYAISLNNLAIVYELQGSYKSAEVNYLQSKSIIKKTYGTNSSKYIDALNNLAILYERQGLYDQVEPLFFKANKMSLDQIDQNIYYLSERQKDQYIKNISTSFGKFHSFVLKRMNENPSIISSDYNYILATKGLQFKSQQRMKNSILQSNDSALVNLYDKWITQRAYLATLYEKTVESRKMMGVDLKTEEAKAQNMEKQLTARSGLFAIENDRKQYTWKDVQKALNQDEAAIEMVRFRYHQNEWTDSIMYMAMIVTKETKKQPELVLLSNGNDLEDKAFKAYRNAVHYKVEDKNSYNNFWKKLNPYLAGKTKVYFSSDGVYHSISLKGLFNPETGNYLSDIIDIQKVSSTRELVSLKRAKKRNKEVKLLGFPAYQKGKDDTNNKLPDRSLELIAVDDGTSRFFSGEDIQPLPGTKVEVDNMQYIMKEAGLSVTTYIAEEATEEAVKTWKNPKIAHIATHGYFLKDKDLEQNANRLGGISKDVLVANPLLRSGLLLANAQNAIKSGGDGILTAYEAKDLNLSDTELVVLSACETGLGEIKNGEGVYGLQRAFQAAGASTVIMSLWTVSDQTTQQFMTMFYQNWLIEKQTKREAFNNAQITLRKDFPEPYYWAAFVLIGE